MPPRKPKRLPLPTSGQLLASVARALDLSIPDQLAGRYFRGESVKPETRDKIVAAVARAGLSALGLDGQPDAIRDAVAASLRITGDRWEDLLGILGSSTRQPRGYRAVVPAFAMVMGVDLALRLGALWRLAGREPFSDRADLAAFTEERRGLFLRDLLARAAITRQKAAELVGVADDTSIDDWLDGRHRPALDNLERFAEALAPSLGGEATALALSLRRYFAIWAVRHVLRDAIGAHHADGILCHVAGYAIDAYAAFGASRLPPPWLTLGEAHVAMHGLHYEPLGHIARHISRTETLPLWRSILRACSGNWLGFLRWAITALTNLEDCGDVPADEMADALLFFLCDPTEPPLPGISVDEWRAMAADNAQVAGGRLEQQGEQRMALEMFQDAARSFRASIEFDRDSPILHYRLGCALWRKESEDRSEVKTDDHERDVGEAERELWLAHTLAPSRNDELTRQLALVEMIWLLLEHGRVQEAVDLAASFPSRFESLLAPTAFAVGEARRLHGDLDGACAAYRETIRKQPTHLLAHEFLAECQRALREERAEKSRRG